MKDKHIINSFKDLRIAIEEVTASQPAKSREQLQKERMTPLKEGKNLMPDIDNIVKTKGAKKVGGSMVDMFTASMIQKVYDKVNEANKKKMEKAPVQVLVQIAQKVMGMKEETNFDKVVEGFASDAQRRAAFASGYKAKGKKILFEGAQGILLDVDHGTYPFVTSSNTVAATAAAGSGCGPNTINYVLGITKAYTTRVGEGPFPTELKDKIGELLGNRGKEFGTVTSRKRRCGWFDGVLDRQTIKISGIDGIALTKLDVLDELEEIKMSIAYELNGKKIDYLPAAVDDQLKVKPIYKTFKGWKSSTKGIKDIEKLPENAKLYIKELEKFIETKISSISTSHERSDTILIESPF